MLVLKELLKEPNVITIGGWYVEKFLPMLDKEYSKEIVSENVKKVDKGDFILRKFADETYSFGIWCDDKKLRPTHGGAWSSRPSVANGLFGMSLIEVIDSSSVVRHIEVSLLEKILPKDYKVVHAKLDNNYHYMVIRADDYKSLSESSLVDESGLLQD